MNITPEEIEIYRNEGAIPTIKAIRTRLKCDLRTAKDIFDNRPNTQEPTRLEVLRGAIGNLEIEIRRLRHRERTIKTLAIELALESGDPLMAVVRLIDTFTELEKE
jgi:hypothetical protein